LDFDPERKEETLLFPGLIHRWCGEFHVTPDITVKPRLTLAKDVILSAYWTYQFSKNLKLLYSEDFNLSNLKTKPEDVMNFGVILEWTL
jgi:hypothetical protein